MDVQAPSTITTTIESTTSPTTHPPAVPAYVLRGHTKPIHALAFLHQNAHLASGDSDGWLVVWSLASKRAVAVWKAHEGAILGLREWGRERLVTYVSFESSFVL
jgi:ASTRA-associated protein 1